MVKKLSKRKRLLNIERRNLLKALLAASLTPLGTRIVRATSQSQEKFHPQTKLPSPKNWLPEPEIDPNPIIQENQNPGTTDWELTNPATKREIEGYASLTSVDRRHKISFYVNTKDPHYTLEIFRMGWYGGAGARRMTAAIELPGIKQPPPLEHRSSGLVECDWQESYILTIPSWTSGVYLAKLTTSQSGKQSYIIFVVRDDRRKSDFLFQLSVTTYQAYNNWGHKSLYRWNSRRIQAYLVSFNRPYAKSPNSKAAYGVGAGEFLTNFQPPHRVSNAGWDYNMLRWLEREGYDVSYATNIDTHSNPELLWKHKAFLSVGHDEYWSAKMRDNVEKARNKGISLGFFGANACFWQIRLDLSPFSKVPDRTIVAYKEYAALDPYRDRRRTTQWRNPPVNLPEDSLIGVMYTAFEVDADIVMDDPPDWMLAKTHLKSGSVLPGLLGYEVDRIYGNAPDNIIRVAHSPYPDGDATKLQLSNSHRDSPVKNRTSYADMTVYTAESGAIVFATGSMQWIWALDDYNAPQLRKSRLNEDAQQVTRNVLRRMIERNINNSV
ncbi:N,N-dimethylformamidase beta subunit family domain-containing protein [Merismopedia glauca]|uniref:N,N-dimethylformamidase beta subunit family domain-containing protein n=1 Tax=Merismopedia glauca TaxID=292586 RepID=UPI0015E75C65|nr:N,N-dimethylformamidase beta subunit family domain-containing protein [Merismopedia glauca]